MAPVITDAAPPGPGDYGLFTEPHLAISALLAVQELIQI
jgi:hypothetical protein